MKDSLLGLLTACSVAAGLAGCSDRARPDPFPGGGGPSSDRGSRPDGSDLVPEAGENDAGRFAEDAPGADLDAATGGAGDAGISIEDAGTASDRCTFGGGAEALLLDPRRALPAARIDDLEGCARANPAVSPAFVDGLLEEVSRHGSNAPPWRNGTAFVLYRGDATGLSVSGSFDGWPSPGLRGFRSIAGTDLSVAEVPLAAGERHQYKLTRSAGNGEVEWSTDPLNRWVTWDGFDLGTVGRFNNEIAGPSYVPDRSFIHRFYVRDRDVFLQLPIDHFAGTGSMGVLYVHDGNEALTRAGMQAVADRTFEEGRALPTALAYVALPDQSVRRDEYTYGTATANGDQYVAMIVDEISPVIERHVRLGPVPESRGLAGASLGGLISFYGAWTRNDFFRLVGAQSPSLFWNGEDMIGRVATGPMISARVYLDSGSPGDNSAVAEEMANALLARGYDHLYVVAPGASHDWAFWAMRFDELLEFLYPP